MIPPSIWRFEKSLNLVFIYIWNVTALYFWWKFALLEERARQTLKYKHMSMKKKSTGGLVEQILAASACSWRFFFFFLPCCKYNYFCLKVGHTLFCSQHVVGSWGIAILVTSWIISTRKWDVAAISKCFIIIFNCLKWHVIIVSCKCDFKHNTKA